MLGKNYVYTVYTCMSIVVDTQLYALSFLLGIFILAPNSYIWVPIQVSPSCFNQLCALSNPPTLCKEFIKFCLIPAWRFKSWSLGVYMLLPTQSRGVLYHQVWWIESIFYGIKIVKGCWVTLLWCATRFWNVGLQGQLKGKSDTVWFGQGQSCFHLITSLAHYHLYHMEIGSLNLHMYYIHACAPHA